MQTTTLDHVTEDLPYMDLMKVDLEGAEARAFDGGREALSRIQSIVLEDWGGSKLGRSAAERIADAGFELHRLDGNNLIGVR